MDIGTNMIEKNGLYLERYTIWDQSSVEMKMGNLFTTVAVSVTFMILW